MIAECDVYLCGYLKPTSKRMSPSETRRLPSFKVSEILIRKPKKLRTDSETNIQDLTNQRIMNEPTVLTRELIQDYVGK